MNKRQIRKTFKELADLSQKIRIIEMESVTNFAGIPYKPIDQVCQISMNYISLGYPKLARKFTKLYNKIFSKKKYILFSFSEPDLLNPYKFYHLCHASKVNFLDKNSLFIGSFFQTAVAAHMKPRLDGIKK